MDKENGFDSDSSDSWSFIDMDNELSSDIKITDETKPKEDIIPDNSAALPVEGVKNELPESSPIIDLNVASSPDNLNSTQEFQVLCKSKIFGDEGDFNIKTESNSIESNSTESNLKENADANSENKDLEEDSDGISVISESECNDIKASTSESDEVEDEKPSGNDGTEKPESNTPRKKGKLPELNSQESSEESMNSDVVTDESSKGVDVTKSENPTQKKQYRSAPVYRHNRNNAANSALNITLGILVTAAACIALGHFIGIQDSQELVCQMINTLKKVQMENMLLHTRLTQLHRARYYRDAEKLDLEEEKMEIIDGDYDDDDDDGSAFISDQDDSSTDDGNHHDRKIDLGKFSLKDSRNFLNYEGLEPTRETTFVKESSEPFETFNRSKYFGDLGKKKDAVKSLFDPENMRKRLQYFRTSEKDKIFGPKRYMDKASNPSDVKTEIKTCKLDGSTAGNTEKGNCLAIREKDLSQFRWFLLKAKPKSNEFDIKNLDIKHERLNIIPLSEEQSREYAERMNKSFKVPEEGSDSNEKDDLILPVTAAPNVGFLYLGESIDDGEIKDEIKPEDIKKADENVKIWKHYYTYDKDLQMAVKEGDKVKLIPLQDKFKEEFESVPNDIKENNGKMKVCDSKTCGFLKDDEITGEQPEEKSEKKMEKRAGNMRKRAENVRKRAEDLLKRAREEKKFKNKKRGHVPIEKKDDDTYEIVERKLCGIKSCLKSGNESGCKEANFKSGDWFSKWAEGREKNRRDQKISDWQFDRAKSRALSRKGDAFWQFSRAFGRRIGGTYPLLRKKKVQPPPPPPRKAKKHYNGQSIRAYKLG